MKILHCCLANFYIEGYGYQENILPREHKKLGHDVQILASTETYVENTKLGYLEPQIYINADGIRVTRVPYRKYLPHVLMRKLRIYKGIPRILNDYKPDIIFIHDCQFVDMRHFAHYARCHPAVTIFVDCHADFFNSAKNWLSKNILHRALYRYCAKIIEPYTTKFYGVLPARCDFLHNVYNISKEKIELLPLGGEDDKIKQTMRGETRLRICNELNINDDNLIMVTGGKLDKKKNIINLIDAIERLDCHHIKFIIFGSLSDDIKEDVEKRVNTDHIKYVGWVNPNKIYDYLMCADLAVFPGLHSVLWEQAVACGIPCIFSDIKGFHHVDTGGNCAFLKDSSPMEIEALIKRVLFGEGVLQSMRQNAIHGARQFLYSDIAKRAIWKFPKDRPIP